MTNRTFKPPGELSTAVLFLVFNRLETTQKVFQEIRKAKPPRLYIAADGARKNKQGEEIIVKQVRNYIIGNIDWKCEVKTLFREDNLGCKLAVSGAIDWFFENEEMGIILEDDCFPSQSFFWYCEELLGFYRADSRIMLISGYNKKQKWQSGNSSYFFSNFGGIWGWASWRRAWLMNDINMPDLDEFIRLDGFRNLLGKIGGRRENSIVNTAEKEVNTWDYQWGFARNKNNGLACVPVISLIENIGFGEGATHTTEKDSKRIIKGEIEIPLSHNSFFFPDRKYDACFYPNRSLKRLFLNLLKRLKG